LGGGYEGAKVQKLAKHSVKQKENTVIGVGENSPSAPLPLDPPLRAVTGYRL